MRNVFCFVVVFGCVCTVSDTLDSSLFYRCLFARNDTMALITSILGLFKNILFLTNVFNVVFFLGMHGFVIFLKKYMINLAYFGRMYCGLQMYGFDKNKCDLKKVLFLFSCYLYCRYKAICPIWKGYRLRIIWQPNKTFFVPEHRQPELSSIHSIWMELCLGIPD